MFFKKICLSLLMVPTLISPFDTDAFLQRIQNDMNTGVTDVIKKATYVALTALPIIICSIVEKKYISSEDRNKKCNKSPQERMSSFIEYRKLLDKDIDKLEQEPNLSEENQELLNKKKQMKSETDSELLNVAKLLISETKQTATE